MSKFASKITISSHNVAGFKRSKSFLHTLCDEFPNSIRAIQEHWLSPPYKKQQGVNQLRCLHSDFDGYGSSGMSQEVESKVRVGKPFGGTGFIYNKKYSGCIKPLVKYQHKRVTAIKLTQADGEIILINAYLPFYDTSNLQSQTLKFHDTVAFIDNIMADNPTARFILLTDMNCNIYDRRHVYSKILLDLMLKWDLFSAFDLMPGFDPSVNYTHFDLKTNSFTLIDGVLLSEPLRDKVMNVRITSHGENLSDHMPVEIDMELFVTETVVERKMNWPVVLRHKLSTDVKEE